GDQIAVAGKAQARKTDILRRVCWNAERARIKWNTGVVIGDVDPREADVDVVQKRSAERVIVLETPIVRFKELLPDSVGGIGSREARELAGRLDAVQVAIRVTHREALFVRDHVIAFGH